MCKHDSQYRVENEANCGVGCPLCNAQKRVEAHVARHAQRSEAQVASSVNYASCCNAGMCEVTLCGQMAADWKDQRHEQSYPCQN